MIRNSQNYWINRYKKRSRPKRTPLFYIKWYFPLKNQGFIIRIYLR
nr:MAG TPA: hypothetical protein [Caudoviricetes sp.]